MGVGKASRSGRFLSQKVSRQGLGESRRILGSVGGSEVSGKSHGIGRESLELESEVWEVGGGTELGISWRSLGSVGGVWVLLGRAL